MKRLLSYALIGVAVVAFLVFGLVVVTVGAPVVIVIYALGGIAIALRG